MCNYFASIQSKFDLLNSTLKSIKNPLIQEKFIELKNLFTFKIKQLQDDVFT